jgi:hypothetical protein
MSWPEDRMKSTRFVLNGLISVLAVALVSGCGGHGSKSVTVPRTSTSAVPTPMPTTSSVAAPSPTAAPATTAVDVEASQRAAALAAIQASLDAIQTRLGAATAVDHVVQLYSTAVADFPSARDGLSTKAFDTKSVAALKPADQAVAILGAGITGVPEATTRETAKALKGWTGAVRANAACDKGGGDCGSKVVAVAAANIDATTQLQALADKYGSGS